MNLRRIFVFGNILIFLIQYPSSPFRLSGHVYNRFRQSLILVLLTTYIKLWLFPTFWHLCRAKPRG